MYRKTKKDNKIIFEDIDNKICLEVIHNDNECIFDVVTIDEKYTLDFIEYFIKELKKTNDILVIISLYNSKKLEDLLSKYNFKVSNYQYTIKFNNYITHNNYDIFDNLDYDSKMYYLQMINKIGKVNHKYYNPNKKYQEIDEKWFNNEDTLYRVYKKDKKIVGISDYKIVDNKVCIRCLLSDDKIVLEDMIKDLLNVYKKDIIINIIYTENNIKEIINNLSSEFNHCKFILVEKIKYKS